MVEWFMTLYLKKSFLLFIILASVQLNSASVHEAESSYTSHYFQKLSNIWDMDYQKHIYITGLFAIPTAFALDNYIAGRTFYYENLSKVGDIYGHRWGYYIALSSVFIVNGIRGNSFQKTGSDARLMLETLLTCAGITELIKWSVERQRPIGYGSNSFPSGHTSGAFALAAVLSHLYGRPVGYAAYGMAAFVGTTRINDQKHYLSDVVTGAIIGVLTGRSFTRSDPDNLAITGYPTTKGIQFEISCAL